MSKRKKSLYDAIYFLKGLFQETDLAFVDMLRKKQVGRFFMLQMLLLFKKILRLIRK
jgi:hypothetical protein